MKPTKSGSAVRALDVSANFFIGVISWGAWLAMAFHLFEGGTFSAAGFLSLKFFTVLSNLFNGTVCLVYAACLLARHPASPRMQTWKLTATSAAALTFFTVMVFLGPVYGYGGMFLGGNFWLHFALPVLSMLVFVLLERGTPLPFRKTLWAVVPVLLYAVGYLGNILVQGVGEWPNRHDFYGFLLWGWPVGVAISIGLALSIWGIAVLLRWLNGAGKTRDSIVM